MDAGKIIIGTDQAAYQSEFVLQTNLINSPFGLQIFSNLTLTSQTKLVNYANSSSKIIQVSECKGWKAGDQIVISTSSPEPSENEKRIIKSIKDCVINLQDPLQFDHFGALDVTIKNNGKGQLDMRTNVLHLKIPIEVSIQFLNFKIQGLNNSCSILINGSTILQGVEFENCGNEKQPGIFLQNQNGSIATQIINCSFHEFNGQMLKLDKNDNLIIKNNVFFKRIQQLVEIRNYNQIRFNNNTLVYVQKSRQKVWAVLGNFTTTELTVMNRTNQDFSSNIGVASEDAGFYILSTKCTQSDSSSFYNQECSSAANSCFVIKQFDWNCDYIGQLSVYKSKIGIMDAITTEEIRVEKIVSAENKIGIIIKGTTQGQINNQIFFMNSYITALARPQCFQCYIKTSQSQNCQNNIGMQIATISSYTYKLIQDNFTSNQYDTITTNERLDIRVFVQNVTFENFKLNYTPIASCQFNSVFRQHPQAYDVTGRHYLTNSTCYNCDFDALLYKFRDSNYSQIGLYNGCGSMECIGMKNTLISDETVDFFGQISQAIGNNTNFGQYIKNCTYKQKWNGYYCKGNYIQILNFMSVAPDYAKRLFSPIKFMENKNIFNVLNSFYEWNWNGKTPKNTRESKFAGLTPKNKSISISVASVNPTSSIFWLSSPQENQLNYLIIKWQFQEKLMIQVKVNEEIIMPGMSINLRHSNLQAMTNQCGANNFFQQNKSIEFVLTNEPFCIVTISLRNFISVKTVVKVKNSFDVNAFLSYMKTRFGNNPKNYYILSVSGFQRRFLKEESENQVEFDWGFVDSSDIGTETAENNIKILEDISEVLYNLLIPSEMEPCSEEQPLNNDTQTDQTQTETNTTINQEEFNPVENESVNLEEPQENSQNMIETQNQIKKEEPKKKSYSIIIILAIVLPIIGAGIIIGFIYYMRNKKLDRKVLYTFTNSAADISTRPQMRNNHSKKLSIATPANQEGNIFVPQNEPQENQ